jgi:hypothetical protein
MASEHVQSMHAHSQKMTVLKQTFATFIVQNFKTHISPSKISTFKQYKVQMPMAVCQS